MAGLLKAAVTHFWRGVSCNEYLWTLQRGTQGVGQPRTAFGMKVGQVLLLYSLQRYLKIRIGIGVPVRGASTKLLGMQLWLQDAHRINEVGKAL